MVDMERFAEILDQVLEEIPEKYFQDLTGGICVSDEVRYNEASRDHDLYVMGEYHTDALGRYILIYYGSFQKVWFWLDEEQLRRELRRVARHELTHHWESLAGEHDLERQDAQELCQYLIRKQENL